jgi:hypothetical protein
MREGSKGRGCRCCPHLLPSLEEEEASLFQNKSGRSGSPREWLISGRAAGRAIVGQQVGQTATRVPSPATAPRAVANATMKLMGQVDLDRHRMESRSTCLQVALASDRLCLRKRLRLDQAHGAVVHDMTIRHRLWIASAWGRLSQQPPQFVAPLWSGLSSWPCRSHRWQVLRSSRLPRSRHTVMALLVSWKQAVWHRPQRSDDHGHRLDLWCGDLSIILGHDHNAHRLDAATAPAKISSIAGQHCHGGLLLLQLLQCDIRPSTAQHVLRLPAIDSLMRDHHQCRVITASHASAAHVAPSIPAPCHTISHITQSASEPPYSVGQARRRMHRDDRKARRGCFCRPSAHAEPPCPDHRPAAPDARGRSAGERPTIAIVSFAPGLHTAFETVSQIDFTDFGEGNDDLLLGGIHHRHLVIRGHARYLCGRNLRAGIIQGSVGWLSE